MLGADAAALFPHIIEDKWLQSFLNFFCAIHVIESLHDGIQVEVAIGDVAVAEDAAAELTDSPLRFENDVLKLARLKRNVEFECEAVVRGGHGDALTNVPDSIFLRLGIAHDTIVVVVLQLLEQLKHLLLHELLFRVTGRLDQDIVLVLVA